PALVHVVLRATLGSVGDRLRRLALGADEEDASAGGGDIAKGDERLVQHRHGLGQVEDVDVVARAVDVVRHLRVPALGAVAEMRARFQQLAHGEIWQSHEVSLLYRLARRAGQLPGEPPDGDEGTPFETHPRVRDGRAYRGWRTPWQPSQSSPAFRRV